MIKRFLTTCCVAYLVTFAPAAIAGCVTLTFLDGDTDGNGSLDYQFFGGNTQAIAAIQQAAADVSAMIDCSGLTAVDSSNNPAVATSSTAGSATVTITSNYNYTNPYTGASVPLGTAVIPAEEIQIFVGGRNLQPAPSAPPGDNGPLGEGGLAGGSASVSTSFNNATDLDLAFSGAVADANTTMGRGLASGNSLLSALPPFTVGSQTETISFAPAIGNIWFDFDTDNDGDYDTVSELLSSWHVDHNTSPTAGKNDLYSVALHEILHAVGLSGHISSANSTTLGIGTAAGITQEPSMDPDILVGTRKYLTVADQQFAVSSGWNVTPVPEPSAATFLLTVSVLFAGVRKYRQR